MIFYLGTHMPTWLRQTEVPLFVSRVRLEKYRGLMPHGRGRWALDSGGFTELDKHGAWTLNSAGYARFVRRAVQEVGRPDFAAPQDWMCEEKMLSKTGLTIAEHQERTIGNYLDLRDRLDTLVIPVLQGWDINDYLRCVESYERAGVDLASERLVGLGTVCRRQDTATAAAIVRRLAAEGIRLHGFGIKTSGLSHPRWAYADALTSCDSMAWSARARHAAMEGEPSCDPARRKSCANCLHFALDYRVRLLDNLRPTLWKETPCETVAT